MKITAVKLLALERPGQKGNTPKLVQVPNLRRIQYTHNWTPGNQPVQ